MEIQKMVNHIDLVQRLINICMINLKQKSIVHEQSYRYVNYDELNISASKLNLIECIDLFCDMLAKIKQENPESNLRQLMILMADMKFPKEVSFLFINTAIDIFGEKA